MADEKSVSVEEYETMKKALSDEILRRDKMIDKLKEENNLLIKTSLKRSEALEDMQKRMQKILEDKNILPAPKRKP